MNPKSWFVVVVMLTVARVTFAESLSPEDEATVTQLREVAKRQGMQLTQEQEHQFLEQQHALRDRMKMFGLGVMMGMPGAKQGSSATAPQQSGGLQTAGQTVETEEALAAKILSLPPRPVEFVVADRKDGFSVNGRAFVDPEGVIKNYSIQSTTGMVTYLVDVEKGTFLVKTTRAGTDAEPITIATATHPSSGWQIQTVTGKRISGQSLTVLASGMLIARDNAAFLYAPGKGLRSVAVPNGYVVAHFQRGDVGDTGFMLIERDKEDVKRGVGGLFDSFKSLGATLGVNKQEDYALFGFSSGKVVPLNISESDKTVGEYSNCRKRNALVNDCANMDFRESLYSNTGRNIGHYFWRINWFATQSGPILIAQENGLKDITVTDLASGKKVTAFSRGLGINGYDAVQNADGKVKVTARLGFSTETLEDAQGFLASTPEIRSPATDEAQSQAEAANNKQ